MKFRFKDTGPFLKSGPVLVEGDISVRKKLQSKMLLVCILYAVVSFFLVLEGKESERCREGCAEGGHV